MKRVDDIVLFFSNAAETNPKGDTFVKCARYI